MPPPVAPASPLAPPPVLMPPGVQPPGGLTLDQAHQQMQGLRSFTLAGPGPAGPPPQLTPPPAPAPTPPPTPPRPPALTPPPATSGTRPTMTRPRPPVAGAPNLENLSNRTAPITPAQADPVADAAAGVMGQALNAGQGIGDGYSRLMSRQLSPGVASRPDSTMGELPPDQRPLVKPTPTTVGDVANVALPLVPPQLIGRAASLALGSRAAVPAAEAATTGARAAAPRISPPPTPKPTPKPTIPLETPPPAAAPRLTPPPVAPVPRPVTPTPAPTPSPAAATAATPRPPFRMTPLDDGLEAAAGPTPGLGRQAINALGRGADFAARNDYVTGVIGPLRNAAGALGNATGRVPNSGSNVMRGLASLGVPGSIYLADEHFNHPGRTDTEHAEAIKNPGTQLVAGRNQLLEHQGEGRGRLLNAAGRMISETFQDPLNRGPIGFGRDNANRALDLLKAPFRNPEGFVGNVAREAEGFATGLTGGTPASHDYNNYRSEYVRLLKEYQDAAAKPPTPENPDPGAAALASFQRNARGIAPLVENLDYSSPNQAGAHLARRTHLAQRVADELAQDPEFANNPDAVRRLRGAAGNVGSHAYFPTPGTVDERHTTMPFPTRRDVADAARYYGQGAQGDVAAAAQADTQLPFGLGRLQRAVDAAGDGRVLQSPEGAAVAAQRYERDAQAQRAQLLAAVRRRLTPPTTQPPIGPAPTTQFGGGVGSLAGQTVPPGHPDENLLLSRGPDAGVYMGPGSPNAATPPGEERTDPVAAKPPAETPVPPPEVQKELSAVASNVPSVLASLAGGQGKDVAETVQGALAAAQTAQPPATLTQYWEGLPPASRVLAIAGLSLAAISFLRSAFSSGDKDDEPGFLMRVLPYLGMGAAAWGLGGGTLWGDKGVSMPQMSQFQNLGSGVMGSIRGLRMGPGPG